jgi:hypothetical protein
MDPALTGVLGTALGGGVGGFFAWLLSRQQIESGKVERLAGEKERDRIRIEEAERDERRDRVRPIRSALDAMAQYYARLAADRATYSKLTGSGVPADEARTSLVGAPEHKSARDAAMNQFHIGFSRAPDVLLLRLIEYLELFKGDVVGQPMDAASVTQRSSAVHEALLEYVAKGTISAGSPYLRKGDETLAKAIANVEARFDEALTEPGIAVPAGASSGQANSKQAETPLAEVH